MYLAALRLCMHHVTAFCNVCTTFSAKYISMEHKISYFVFYCQCALLRQNSVHLCEVSVHVRHFLFQSLACAILGRKMQHLL